MTKSAMTPPRLGAANVVVNVVVYLTCVVCTYAADAAVAVVSQQAARGAEVRERSSGARTWPRAVAESAITRAAFIYNLSLVRV